MLKTKPEPQPLKTKSATKIMKTEKQKPQRKVAIAKSRNE
jgi:hypothetical protein